MKFGVASTKKKVEMKEEVEEMKAACQSFEGTKLEGTKKQMTVATLFFQLSF